jgi:hypothetical protein
MRIAFGLLSLLICTALQAQPEYQLSDFSAPRTTSEERTKFLENERAEMLRRLAIPPGKEAEGEWPGAFWSAGLTNYKGPEVCAAIHAGFDKLEELSPDLQREILQSAYYLCSDDFTEQARRALDIVQEPKPFAIALAHVLKHDDSLATRRALALKLAEKFPDWRNDGRLAHFWRLLTAEEYPELPPLADLLAHDFDGKAVVFSFQRRDRRHPGRAVVRGDDGRFVRTEDGAVLTIPQLAYSQTNLPGTITYGNTPQGLHTIVGTGIARDKFIGPVPYVWTKVPFEAPLEEFFHDDTVSGEWTLPAYQLALPPSWRGYWPMQEAWYAGRAGRNEMIAHGTTINEEFYRGEPWYPYTPSAGCLCMREQWSPETGALVASDQLTFLNTFLQQSDGTGFLLVVELDDRQAPVSEEEVRSLIAEAETK